MRFLTQYDLALHGVVSQFLAHESELLDNRQLKQWQATCVDESIRYVIPLRLTMMNEDGNGISETAYLQDDDWNALTMRINRFDSRAAWSENPATRVRHFVSNVRVGGKVNVDETSDSFDVTVKSNVLIYRSRGPSPEHDLLSAERIDVLRQVNGDMKLLLREVRLDSSVIGTHNFSFIF
ncbi:aromatic-ring-hydroxylating dioxygenase subunit beta [Pseudomonas citronellolis]|uniref:aromatic-ring-hydroxylating dioxygenase subunit beta n=1 Tax=Pseudomonas citronellolis TaxID=53408 RepID=UPI000852C97B|nr:aromatic-ring-hydroxylating dioxygenase subunit beta [Pseudomonas humi]